MTAQPIFHVIVLELDDVGARIRPDRPNLYVGTSSHTPETLADVNGYHTELEPLTSIDAYTTDETDELLAVKADQTDFNTLDTRLNTNADQTDLDTLDTRLNTRLDTKADSATLRPASPSLPITVDSTAFLVAPPSMVIGHDGRPVIAHLDFRSQLPEVATCQTSDCRAGVLIHEPPLLAVPAVATGTNGVPIVAYAD